jgi:solute carrier family 66 (lysosomal lysine-arginine transporter), member 1
VWFIGDVTNLAGAAWAGLVPTVIALAVYFCFADFILISQCLYYNVLNARREKRRLSRAASSGAAVNEHEPLLTRQESGASNNSAIGLPGSHTRRRSSAASNRTLRNEGPAASAFLEGIAEEQESGSGWLRNVLSVSLVCAIGAVGWAIAYKSGIWRPAPEIDGDDEPMALGAQVLGYVSAVAYLG